MQGLHHQQQQLAALLSVALPKDDVAGAEDDESARISALQSLQRAIIYPPNSLLVAHSAAFLAQGLSTLLSDKSLLVRQLAARVYGALCSVVSSIQLTPSGRQNQIVLRNLVDHFISWALPLLGNINAGEGMTELALESLLEFVNVRDVGVIERYALPILKACQVLLENERTSMNLLRQLLGLLTLVSLKFPRCFQPHFADFVDLLLGWALVPDLAESDRRVIMDSFLQFQKHWVSSFQFSMGLLSKFLGDIDVLLQDGNPGTLQQFRRLLALLSCFCTVLQSTASGMLELKLLQQIKEPVSKVVPRLLGCLSLVGKKFGWSKWVTELSRCLTLLAEILGETFSSFYPLAMDILFQSLSHDSVAQVPGMGKFTTFDVHGVLKTNLQLLSLQKRGLLPSSVVNLLRFDKPISQLRLHPNHLVTGSSAATYMFLLQHESDEVVEQAMDSLTEELELLANMLRKILGCGLYNTGGVETQSYSKAELFALINFDLKVMLSCINTGGDNTLFEKADAASLYLQRSKRLISDIIEKLNPFHAPIEGCMVLQARVIETVEQLSAVEFLCQCFLQKAYEKTCTKGYSDVILRHLNKYSPLIMKAIHFSSPLMVKLRALEWIRRFCEGIFTTCENLDAYICVLRNPCTSANFVFPVLDAASDQEPTVRMHVASVLELLIRAKLVHPEHFRVLSTKVLERLGDPEGAITVAFLKLSSNALTVTYYLYGLSEFQISSKPSHDMLGGRPMQQWKQILALKQTKKRLHSQQLVSILSYLSQKWKVPLSSWVQRLISSCRNSKDSVSTPGEQARDSVNCPLQFKEETDDTFERICSVNNLAGAFWAIHEASRYCILMRLRTNLGGPTQTFAALERMLLDIVHAMQIDTEQQEGNMNIIGSSGAHLLPMRLLLDFVEALKKNVFNAYEGSIILEPAPRQSSLFFRANKKVCEEWFSRICEPMMKVGLALQCHDATIHYCTLRLMEMKNLASSASSVSYREQASEKFLNNRTKFTKDVLRMLRHMALALCRCHDAESLIGLLKWAKVAFFSFPFDGDTLIDDEVRGPLSWISGLVYLAKGQYEKAAAHFTLLLQNEESLASMGADGIQFAICRIIESYTAVSDWKSLDLWLSELQSLRAKHAGKTYSGALTMAGNDINDVHALAHFDNGDYQAAWSSLNLTPKGSSELTLEPRLALRRSEQMLLQAMLHKVEGKEENLYLEIGKAKSMMEQKMSILPLDGLLEAAEYATQLQCIFVFEEGCNVTDNHEKGKQIQSIVSSHFKSTEIPLNAVHQDCNLWLKLLRVHRTINPLSPITLNLTNSLLTLARKQSNLGLASSLYGHLRDYLSLCSEMGQSGHLLSHLQYEGALLMHAENKLEDAITELWSFVRPCIVSPNNKGIEDKDGILKAKACLKLADWLRQDLSHTSVGLVPKMLEDIMSEISCPDSEISCDHEHSFPKPSGDAELIVGTVTKLSSLVCPAMGKSWISYASWCFNLAKRHLSTTQETSFLTVSPVLFPEIVPGIFKTTDEEKALVESIICQLYVRSKGSGNQERDSGVQSVIGNENDPKALVHQILNAIEVAAGAPGAEQGNGETLFVKVGSQLRVLFIQANIGIEEAHILPAVNSLLEIWWSLRRRKVTFFGHAALGYIQYLSYSSVGNSQGLVDECISESIKHKAASYTNRATLYVLHILLNYGAELKDALEPALANVPLLPWQEITPQLFARLSFHPEPVVRKQLEGLLNMLAKHFPWSIVYPTLVDVNACEEGPSEELRNVLGCLTTLYPRLVQDVQLMINELGNVTVLWEELWVSTLQDLHTDVIRRINLLKEEAMRIAENATLTQNEKNKINAAKYSAMMAPIVVTLERRLASTSRKPETPHEIWFHESYGEQLKSAILSFKTPPASAGSLGEVWRPFDSIVASLAAHQRRFSVTLGDVAPKLALLSSSDIPMPGHEKHITIAESDKSVNPSLQGIVTVASFSDKVTILSTKTKPKKIVLLGSDGESYTYLLKGREDLRLDARIMQLLQAVNGFLRSSSTTHSRPLGIRYYSVTPISGRAGLIQWVDNAVSIYSVFKSWQNRTQLSQLSTAGTGDFKDAAAPSVPRPSDIFYGKIIPALKEKGIRRVISRRDWPHEVKRKVLLDLMNEAPRQLLYHELWCASEGFKAFNSKLKRYSGSVAAMSMVGHVLGLGDRHLDNILIDLCSGDIVHIDYNICFDKGLRLKIPEIVPFRLTQTMEAALGLTGLEGNFRSYCETVLDVLRKNKDLILMLLEVFVWDPLVEWTRGDFHDDAAIVGEERKGMELAVSLSLFASRVQEIRVPLQEHHDLLLTSLPAVENTLERFTDVLNQYEVVSTVYYHADQERCNLTVRENSVKSAVAQTMSNFEKTRASFEMQAREFSEAKSCVAERTQEATSWIEQHGRIIDALRNTSMPEIDVGVTFSSYGEALSLTSAVVVAKVPLTIVPEPTQVQCQDIDKEVSQHLLNLDSALASAVNTMKTYSVTLQRILPTNYVITSPVHGWVQILQRSLNSISSDVLVFARRQAAELISEACGGGFDSIKQKHRELCFTVQNHAEQIEKVEEEIAQLQSTISSDAELIAKDRVVSAFLKFMQSAGLNIKEDSTFSLRSAQPSFDGIKGRMHGDKMERVLSVLNTIVGSIYKDVKNRVLTLFGDCHVKENSDHTLQSDSGSLLYEFEEQVEKCVLVAEFVNELQRYADFPILHLEAGGDGPVKVLEKLQASTFKSSLLLCKNLMEQLTETILPNMVKCILSYSSEVMDAFGSVSQMRGSIDTALEQLIEVEMERTALGELEQNYSIKVGFITEQQMALEEASMNGRDHLSWEEAEELVSQEEACRAQLQQLHQAWNQKDVKMSLLMKRESSIRNVLTSSESHFQALTSSEEESTHHILGKKQLLRTLVNPFRELEAVDKTLSAWCASASCAKRTPISADLVDSGLRADNVWKAVSLLNDHFFYVWRVGILDTLLDSCVHDPSSSLDQNMGFDQLYNKVKRKVESLLHRHIGQYLKERVVPVLLAWLDRETDQMMVPAKEYTCDQVKKDVNISRRMQLLLEEYCNAHETAGAANSAASVLKRQLIELKELLCRTSLEIVQMEWMYDGILTPSRNNRVLLQRYMGKTDNLSAVILNLNRPELLDSLKSTLSTVSKSVECLQVCEQSSINAEGQLERAMGWACGGPSTNSSGNASSKGSGIPPEFHDHLLRRKQLLWEACEKASDIMKLCMSILEFEVSRDIKFHNWGENFTPRSGDEGNAWQQAYMNALTRLDVSYHSFKRTEQEWKVAQSSMEAASNNLLSATNELRVASLKAQTASGDLQSIVLAMRDCASEASVSLSAFARATKDHTALTSECGSMLEEVLAITEGLHDVHKLGKEAALMHHSLLEYLSKANKVLFPLESMLSKDVAAMTEAISKERETKIEISQIHGQAIYQSYCLRIKEACQTIKPMVPTLMSSVKGLHNILTRLARTASIHAGNLHKALEGVGESDEERSQEIDMSRNDFDIDTVELISNERESVSRSEGENVENLVESEDLSSQDKGWISPPDSVYSSSSGSSITSADASAVDDLDSQELAAEDILLNSNGAVTPDDLNSIQSNGETGFQEILQNDPPKSELINVNRDNSGTLEDDGTEATSLLVGLTLSENISAAVGEGDSKGKPDVKNDVALQNNTDSAAGDNGSRLFNTAVGSRALRGKNSYALSVLRRVEMKLDGRDVPDKRESSVCEQVDYLLRQATSIDNLCNMYEGWTPWI
uniref:non-specific serine/threonine protein kinase n=1 Tax=Kalanchoe fedtschenkoi TaxID=63787 RepID=A0A7N0T1F2_KALFE